MTGKRPSAATLVAWQRTHGRHALPWQRTRDPYRVWLSEIMLQQTQVATVLGYYERFLLRFPDVRSLAAAPQDEVLALWSGLGYYSRARNLHACARAVIEHHGGSFPNSSAALAKLPGIGRSTAAAIAAFCFGERTAILDGNVKRVLTRALGFGDDLAEAAHERRLWQHAEALLPKTGIEAYTQGLMDLGATVCTVRRPACDACPWSNCCVARAEGRPEAYPVKTRKLKRGRRENSLLLLTSGAQLWLVQRPAPGVWAGLWSLPEFTGDEAVQAFAAQGPGRIEALPHVHHVLTHFDWQLKPWHWQLPPRTAAATRQRIESALPGDGRWFARDEALAAGLPAPVRRLIDQLA
ncbi:A/G-specific adenine glycosylase [Aquincola sp. S2]|uniref:Adenine DNA glycosylase n=1 Tax=Pseudaquabacterium terrae TaxID=2732868 RepID=A0ABX2ETW6_9BURK|nr:A/G-specific adenine glycosylase [Aquabacterium terrae]